MTGSFEFKVGPSIKVKVRGKRVTIDGEVDVNHLCQISAALKLAEGYDFEMFFATEPAPQEQELVAFDKVLMFEWFQDADKRYVNQRVLENHAVRYQVDGWGSDMKHFSNEAMVKPVGRNPRAVWGEPLKGHTEVLGRWTTFGDVNEYNWFRRDKEDRFDWIYLKIAKDRAVGYTQAGYLQCRVTFAEADRVLFLGLNPVEAFGRT